MTGYATANGLTLFTELSFVTVRMHNILNPNLSMSVMSADNPLPRMSNAVAEAVTQKHPIILNAYDHDFMMDEISRH